MNDYISDTAYTAKYLEILAPITIKFNAALNDMKTSIHSHEFTYLDLGCGNGLTLCILAAANPRAHFIGVDMLKEHIDYANNLIKHGQLKNVTLINNNFSDLDLNDFPDCDYIVAHGVISWVSEKVHAQIRTIIQKKLKKGGLCYLSYNALPGWSAFEPVKKIFQEFTDERAESIERIHEGISLINELYLANGKYTAQNTEFEKILRVLHSSDEKYLAHEYMSPSRAFYFFEINQHSNSAGLSFVSNINPANDLAEVKMNEQALRLLQSQESQIKREGLKDYLCNTEFRRDVYLKETQHTNLVDTIYLTMNSNLKKYDVEIVHLNQTYHLNHPIYQVLMEIINHDPILLEEILNNEKLNNYSRFEILEKIKIFAALQQIIPLTDNFQEYVEEHKHMNMTHPFNKYLLHHSMETKSDLHLVSPCLGGALLLSYSTAVLLHSLFKSKGRESLALDLSSKILIDYSKEAVKDALINLKASILPVLVRHKIIHYSQKDPSSFINTVFSWSK